jgi:hypothetical protein
LAQHRARGTFGAGDDVCDVGHANAVVAPWRFAVWCPSASIAQNDS